MAEMMEKYSEYGGHFIVAGIVFSVAVCWCMTRKAKPCASARSREEKKTLDGNQIAKQEFSMEKVPADLDAIVIGSGMGGLTTAAILAKEGKKVLVLDRHDTAGGCTRTFEKNGYEFDAGLHYVGGNIGSKGTPLRSQLDYITEGSVEWERMDDEYDVAIVQNAANGSRDNDDRVLIHRNWNVLIPRLKEMFPTEHDAIDKFFQLVQQVMRWVPVYFALKRLPKWMKSLIEYIFASKFQWFHYTTSHVLDSLTTNAKLKGVLGYFWGNYGEVPERGAFFCHCMCWDHYAGAGGFYPLGGPSVLAHSVIPVIERYGGRVLVRAPVSEILINETNHTAYGVKVEDNVICARTIVSAVGAQATFTKLISPINQSLVKEQIEFVSNPKVAPNLSMMSLVIGLEGDAKDLKIEKKNFWILTSWDHNEAWKRFTNDKDSSNALPAIFASFSSVKDPSYSKRHSKNKQVAVLIAPCTFDAAAENNGKRVKYGGVEYETKKEMWTKSMMDIFVREFPHLEDKISYQKIGSAVTNDFRLGAELGTVYGLSHTPERYNAPPGITPETPIRNLYLTGQDVLCCGIIGAVGGGFLTASAISKKTILRMTAEGVTLREKNGKYF